MKNTSIALGEHFDTFVAAQIASGRYRSASEVMREALRLLETQTRYRDAVVAALVDGEESGISERTPEDIRAAVKEDLELNGAIPADPKG